MVKEEHPIFIFLGEALTGHVISVQEASSEIDCTSKCLSNPNCASFNFEIQQPRPPSICELNNVSRMYYNKTLKRNDSFAYYEPITPRERPKKEIPALCPTTSNIITDAVTSQGTQEVSPTQDQAATSLRTVPSAQLTTTVAPGVKTAPGKWFEKLNWDWFHETSYLLHQKEFPLSRIIRPLLFARLTLYF